MLTKVPQWIQQLGDLSKFTLSMIVLRTDTLDLLSKVSSLFSPTFSFSEAKQVPYLSDIIHKNKSDSEGEIVVPDGGFKGLKLLRFATPVLPMLIFSENAMQGLERLEMRFKVLEGVFGMDNLAGLQMFINTVYIILNVSTTHNDISLSSHLNICQSHICLGNLTHSSHSKCHPHMMRNYLAPTQFIVNKGHPDILDNSKIFDQLSNQEFQLRVISNYEFCDLYSVTLQFQ